MGTGPVVLLLHGLGGTADFSQPIARALARTYTVICPDLLGFGFSDKPRVDLYTRVSRRRGHGGAAGGCCDDTARCGGPLL